MRRNRLRLTVALLSALALAGGLMGTVHAQQRHILLIEVKGIIDPISERFITRAIGQAEADGAVLLVIKLDTPGGLLSSTREITQQLLEADVPTVVYVSPRGARAASAGTFITAAANFAVMAPGTNIGAASPVGSTGEDLPETLKSKVTSDAAAEIRSIAAARGRNQEKLEETVLLAAAFTAEEAVELDMVDFIAGDMDDLLAQLHGQQTSLHPPGGERVVMDTQGLAIRTMEPTLVERFLRFLADPNVSYLLLTLGSLGLLLELLNPGMVVPGVVGAILLILALVTLGSLPVNWAGVALILLAVGLTVLEFYVAGYGILGVGAIVSFALGGFLLFFHTGGPSPTEPSIGVSLWLLVPTVLALSGGGGWALYTIIQSRRGPPDPGIADLIGKTAEVATDLSPRGTVQLQSELWTAVAEGGRHIAAGEAVVVVKTDGIILTVARPPENT
ncbi:MAG: nodulation protein NfeD [Chloroflexi bacterium]|nr:nodulation protein NfeD [Chloroflexota bacterium]